MPGRLVLLILLAALFGAPSAASAARNDIAAVTPPSRTDAAKQPIGPDGLAREAPLLLLLLGGLMGVTALAVAGTALVSGRRRRGDDGSAAAMAQEHETASVLERRTVRRARMRLDDDPIVASLGVGNARDRSRPRRRAATAVQNAAERDGRPQRS